MAVKRGLVAEAGNDNPKFQETQQRNQLFKFSKRLCKDEWLQKYSAQLENLFRKVVREEIELALPRFHLSNSRSSPTESEGGLSKFRKFKLQFEGQLPCRLYTGNRIEAEGASPIKVVLLDSLSGRLVTDGPLSSVKVELVALHGHFKAELLQEWTQKEFNDNIVPARDGKRPLLVGERVVALCNGIGFINGISFTDNSSWERSKMFRLGAKIELKMAKEDQVREAVSSPLDVKDRRGETYQKSDALSLEDEVWRLKGIAKDGKICQRLTDHQIYKVKDFLQIYRIDQSLLRNILRVPPKRWEAIVQQVALSFSSDVCTNLTALAPRHICHESISPSSVSNLDLHHFCAPGASQGVNIVHTDQPDVQTSYTHGMGTSCELDQSMALTQDKIIDNNMLIGDLLAGSCDDGQNWYLGYNLPPPSFPSGLFYGQDMFNIATSNWLSISQSTADGGNGLVLGPNGDSPIQILSSIPNLGASTSGMAGSKAGWSKLRAKWRILVKYDDAALKKGKFPCNE